jgi:ABC-type oligopeptide transport system substrate-binding subunit
MDEFLERRVDRRQFLARAAALGLSTSAASALLAACGSGSTTPTTSSASNSPTPAKTLSWRPLADVSNVDPAIIPGLEDPTYAGNFFESLITHKPGTTEVVNCLADSLERSSDSLQFHFELKEASHGRRGTARYRRVTSSTRSSGSLG